MKVILNIIKFMQNKQINASELCRQAEINRSTFENWKKGSQPTADKIELICKALQVTPNDLFEYCQPEPEASENEKELLQMFRTLSERDQIKLLGKIEEMIRR